jgi:hypothetical protein
VLIVVAAVAALLLAALLGGRLVRLAGVRLRAGAWLATALLVQTVALLLPPGWIWAARVGHVGSYLIAGGFLWANRRVPGVLLVGLGGLANGLAIAVNAGTLPADPDALARAGVAASSHGLVNSGVLEHPRLALLGDVFAVPAEVPFANVFSVGDVLVVAGVLLAALWICGTWWSTAWEPPPELRARPGPGGVRTRPSPGTGPPAALRCRPGTGRPGRRRRAGDRSSPPPASPSGP